MGFLPTCHGPFWKDNLFGSEMLSPQLTILLYFIQVEEFAFFYSNLDTSHVPAEQVAYQNVCHWFGS